MSNASTAPPPPTIVINTPGAPTSSVSAPRTDPPKDKSRPEKPALVKQCYLCDEQNPGDFSPTTKFLETCLLCSRHFCPIHKSVSWEQVCNINHSEYYRKCLEKARQVLIGQGKSPSEANRSELAEMLIDEGIYPSLGEREKAIFTTSPVSDSKVQELSNYRSLDAAMEGTSTHSKSQLIEEKDFIGADIAV